MTLRLNGSTSGYVEIDAPAVAANNTLILPANGFGKVLQVVMGTANTALSTTSTSFVTTGLTASITPSSTSSKILVMTSMNVQKTSDNIFSGISTAVFRGTVAGTLLQEGLFYTPGNVPTGQVSYNFLDSPNTTSAQTYTVGYKTNSGSTTVTVMPGGLLATMILIEVAA